MSQKKETLRKCIVTKEQFPKAELLRIVKSKDGRIFVDETGKLNGKGVYLKKDLDIINKAEKSKILNKYLEIDVNDEIYEELRKII